MAKCFAVGTFNTLVNRALGGEGSQYPKPLEASYTHTHHWTCSCGSFSSVGLDQSGVGLRYIHEFCAKTFKKQLICSPIVGKNC